MESASVHYATNFELPYLTWIVGLILWIKLNCVSCAKNKKLNSMHKKGVNLPRVTGKSKEAF